MFSTLDVVLQAFFGIGGAALAAWISAHYIRQRSTREDVEQKGNQYKSQIKPVDDNFFGLNGSQNDQQSKGQAQDDWSATNDNIIDYNLDGDSEADMEQSKKVWRIPPQDTEKRKEYKYFTTEEISSYIATMSASEEHGDECLVEEIDDVRD